MLLYGITCKVAVAVFSYTVAVLAVAAVVVLAAADDGDGCFGGKERSSDL